MDEPIQIALIGIITLLIILLGLSVEMNLMQCVSINEFKGKEKVYRMQIQHYNPEDYTLQLKETR